MIQNEGTLEQRFEQYLKTLSPQKRMNMRKVVSSAGFQRVMEIVNLFKPTSGGTGKDNSDGNFCTMRLAEIRGWESLEGLIRTIPNYTPQPTQEEPEEEFQPPRINIEEN